MNESGKLVIETRGVSRGFRQGPKRVQVLMDVLDEILDPLALLDR